MNVYYMYTIYSNATVSMNQSHKPEDDNHGHLMNTQTLNTPAALPPVAYVCDPLASQRIRTWRLVVGWNGIIDVDNEAGIGR